jgi:hypothetical protein
LICRSPDQHSAPARTVRRRRPRSAAKSPVPVRS